MHVSTREGNGTPLQYSCLENPMDRGACWAAVHGVCKSQTRLRGFTFTFHFHALEKEMPTHSIVLAWKIPGMGSLVGCRLWGRIELDTTEAAQQQQQQHVSTFNVCKPNNKYLLTIFSLFILYLYFTFYIYNLLPKDLQISKEITYN